MNGDTVAYFSMEIALEPDIPTYSGGLGVLAGDTLRAAADINFPMVGITLAHRKGYFRQHLAPDGQQSEEAIEWHPEARLEPVAESTAVMIEGRRVLVHAWRYQVAGLNGTGTPVYLLDTDVSENSEYDRRLTDVLYGGDSRYRLCQEVVLGIGGIKLLHRLGYHSLSSYHMNEGHAALLSLALLEDVLGDSHLGFATLDDVEAVRRRCVFTTHTPVPAGHDQFSRDLVEQVLGRERAEALEVTHCCPGDKLNMTFLALRCSRYINGVAMHHGEVSQHMFPQYPIHAITNGVHATTWTSPPFEELFDKHVPPWRKDNAYLRYAVGISSQEILRAHSCAKKRLLDEVTLRTGVRLGPDVFTIGFARRATEYKRTDFLFHDPERLSRIAREKGAIQILFAGKAHPKDEAGKDLIRRVISEANALNTADLRVVYLEEYDMNLAKLLVAGVDLWLNTPLRPMEASGTSGMKAALNGVPSLSVPDGWWIEGCVEGVTGWAIDGTEQTGDPVHESNVMYDKLEKEIIPMYYRDPLRYAELMRWAIALNGSFFNCQRMLRQYIENAYAVQKREMQQAHSSPALTREGRPIMIGLSSSVQH
ncbi:MAG TPA: alpha-glucan family phosphorylase [Terriglobales bacterium]